MNFFSDCFTKAPELQSLVATCRGLSIESSGNVDGPVFSVVEGHCRALARPEVLEPGAKGVNKCTKRAGLQKGQTPYLQSYSRHLILIHMTYAGPNMVFDLWSCRGQS